MFYLRFLALAIVITFSCSSIIHAEETDQFTLPPTKLYDMGSQASQTLYKVLEKIIATTNGRIDVLRPLAEHSQYAAKLLAERQSGSFIANEFYKKSGPGFPRWLQYDFLHSNKNANYPIYYKVTWSWNSVYWLVFSQSIIALKKLAPTINMYGYYFGTDKLDHFFMQGNTYYNLYNYLINHHRTPEQANAALVVYGRILEHTYLGTLINGVYSNGDLSANYAGWKFYTNISQSVNVGNQIIPPILVLRNNKWEFSKHIDKHNLLKPFISDNLNEAWNPCRYSFNKSQIRRLVSKRCDRWVEENHLTPQLAEAKLKETSLWHGEDYGHWLPKNDAVTLEVCFEKKKG